MSSQEKVQPLDLAPPPPLSLPPSFALAAFHGFWHSHTKLLSPGKCVMFFAATGARMPQNVGPGSQHRTREQGDGQAWRMPQESGQC